MDPIMLVEVLDTHGRVQARHRLVVAGSVCRIGRGLTCDIVLDDAYAAAEHTELILRDDGRVTVKDLGSQNGTRVGKQLLTQQSDSVIDSGQLIIGRTRVRVRTMHTPVTPERLFKRDNLQRYRTVLAMLGLTLSLGIAAFQQWEAAPEHLAPQLLTALLGTLFIIGVWAGIWGLVTRVSHGTWNMRTHIAIATNAAAIALCCAWLLGVAEFAMQWRGLAGLASVVVVAALLGALYLHLRKATHLTVRSAALIALLLPLALGSTAAWIQQQGSARDVNRVSLGANIYPPQWRIARSKELDEYSRSMAELKRKAGQKRQESLADIPIAPADDAP